MMQRIRRECCDKETFATKEVAEMRLRTVQSRFEPVGKMPCRAYSCKHDNWHLTSITEEQWANIQEYEAKHRERLAERGKEPVLTVLSAVTEAAMIAMERDGACIICSGDRGLGVMIRGIASNQASGVGKKELRQTILSNVITVCLECEGIYGKSVNTGWEGGWKLEHHMDPERYPVLHHGVWVFLNNDGSVNLAEEPETPAETG
jgi:hypothetical protein